MSEIVINLPGPVPDTLLDAVARALTSALHRTDITVTRGYVESDKVKDAGPRGWMFDHLSKTSVPRTSAYFDKYVGDDTHGEVKHSDDGFSFYCIDGCRGHVRMSPGEYRQHRRHVHDDR